MTTTLNFINLELVLKHFVKWAYWTQSISGYITQRLATDPCVLPFCSGCAFKRLFVVKPPGSCYFRMFFFLLLLLISLSSWEQRDTIGHQMTEPLCGPYAALISPCHPPQGGLRSITVKMNDWRRDTHRLLWNMTPSFSKF